MVNVSAYSRSVCNIRMSVNWQPQSLMLSEFYE